MKEDGLPKMVMELKPKERNFWRWWELDRWTMWGMKGERHWQKWQTWNCGRIDKDGKLDTIEHRIMIVMVIAIE